MVVVGHSVLVDLCRFGKGPIPLFRLSATKISFLRRPSCDAQLGPPKFNGIDYRPGAGYLSPGHGFACTIVPMIMHGLSERLLHAWFTPSTTAVSPGRSRVSSVSLTR